MNKETRAEGIRLSSILNFSKSTLSDYDLAQKVLEQLERMYEPPYIVPYRSIPALPDEDFDLLVGSLIIRFLEKVELIRQIRPFDIEFGDE